MPSESQPSQGSRKTVLKVVGIASLAGMLAAGIAQGPTSTSAHDAISLSAVHQPAPAAKAKPAPTGAAAKAVDCHKLKCIALTFDDGPSVQTDRVLKVLAGAHMKATFFMVGIQVQAYPEIARRVSRAGHEIGDHTWDHKNLTVMTPQQAKNEIARTRTEIAHATGRTPQLFRPPYGSTTPEVAALAGSLGMPEVLWSIDTDDWLNRNAATTFHNAIRGVKRGSVILMHDLYPSTVDALPQIIKALRKQGFTLVTVSQLAPTMKPGVEYFAHH